MNNKEICNKKLNDGKFKLTIDGKEKSAKNNPINKFIGYAILFKDLFNKKKDFIAIKDIGIIYESQGIKIIFPKDLVNYETISPFNGDEIAFRCFDTADELMASCPSDEERRQIRMDFNIAFEETPENWSCTDGGDESSIMLTMYNTFRLMQCIPFNEEFEWDHEYNNLYEWFKMHKPDLIYYYTCDEGECYNYARDNTINLVVDNLNTEYFRRTIDIASGNGAIFLSILTMHEARHTLSGGGLTHTCGSSDHNLEEMGSWAVQYYLLHDLARNTGSYFTEDQRDNLNLNADYTLELRFCDY